MPEELNIKLKATDEFSESFRRENNETIELYSDLWVHSPTRGFHKIEKGRYRLTRLTELQYILASETPVPVKYQKVVSGNVICSWIENCQAKFDPIEEMGT